MTTRFDDMESQSQMHSFFADEPVTVTPQKTMRTPLKMIGGQLLNRHDTRTPSSVSRSKMLAEGMSIGGSPFVFGTPCSKSTNRSGSCVSSNTGQRANQKPKVYNPFDNALIDKLQSPVFSPSVFAHTKTPGSCNKTPPFRWNIDELALIKPMNFDELQDGYVAPWESEVEARAQVAIDNFFARHNMIVPSPCPSDKVPVSSQKFADSFQHSSHLGRVSEEKSVVDVGCQTTLTLPVDFALDRLLAEFYTYTSMSDEVAELSNSSLRRKLFSNVTETSFNLPSCPEIADLKSTPSCISPHVSPVRGCRTPEPGSAKTISVHASGYFSSSPIKNLQKTTLGSGDSSCGNLIRRSSTAPRLIDSPSLSPLEKCSAASGSSSAHSHVSPLGGSNSQNMMTSGSGSGLSQKNHCVMTPGLSPIFGFAEGTASTPSPSDNLYRKCVNKAPLPLDLWDDEAQVSSDVNGQQCSAEDTTHPSSVMGTFQKSNILLPWQENNNNALHSHCNATSNISSSLPVTGSQHESGFQSTVLSGHSMSSSLCAAVVGTERPMSLTSNLTRQFQNLRSDTPDAGIEVTFPEAKGSRLSIELDSGDTRMSVLESSWSAAGTLPDCWNRGAEIVGLGESEPNFRMSYGRYRHENMSFEQTYD